MCEKFITDDLVSTTWRLRDYRTNKEMFVLHTVMVYITVSYRDCNRSTYVLVACIEFEHCVCM